MNGTTVTITAGSEPVNVISEKIIEDGRQRLVNGTDLLEPGETGLFVVQDGKQSVRIEAVVTKEG